MIDRRQELALRAALFPHPEAVEAWQELRRMTSIEELDHSVTRILPSVYRNIKDSLEENDLMKLKGSVRHTWAKNSEFLQQLRPVIRELENAKVNYRVLKGGAINLLNTPPNFRIMGDIDLLISKKDILKTRNALITSGFKPKYSYACPHGSELSMKLELNFNNDQSLEIDIHIAEQRTESPLFRRMLNTPAQFIQFTDTIFLVPSLELLVIHSLVHGQLGVESEDQAQTMLDVELLLQKANIQILRGEIASLGLASTFNRYLELRQGLMLGNKKNTLEGPIKNSRSRIARESRIRNYLGMWGKALFYRAPRLRDCVKIGGNGHRHPLIYLIWLYTGMIRPVEVAILSRLGGFLPHEEFPILKLFPGSQWSNDWRFSVRKTSQEKRLALLLKSNAFVNQSFLIFNNGFLAAVTSRSESGEIELILKNPETYNEISIRLPFAGCKKCAQGLSDLTIDKKY